MNGSLFLGDPRVVFLGIFDNLVHQGDIQSVKGPGGAADGAFGSLAGQLGQVLVKPPALDQIVGSQPQCVGIPQGGRHGHDRIGMQYHVRLEFLEGQNLTLGIDGEQGNVLIRTDLETEHGCLVLGRLDGRTGKWRGKHVTHGDARFAFAVIRIVRPFFIKPRSNQPPGLGRIVSCKKQVIGGFFWLAQVT